MVFNTGWTIYKKTPIQFLYYIHTIWAASWQNQQNDCAPSKDSDQPGFKFTESDQSSLSAWRKIGSLATQWTHSKDSITLGRCPGWSESSLGAHAILLVLSWGGSFNVIIKMKKICWCCCFQKFATIKAGWVLFSNKQRDDHLQPWVSWSKKLYTVWI